jgi:hypothetical protein
MSTKVLLSFGTLALLARCVSAQTPVDIATSFSHHQHIVPTLVSATPTDVWTQDVYLEAMSLSNESAGSVTCTIQDKQGTPRSYFKTVAIAANSTYNDQSVNRRFFPGGLTWSCSSGTAVTGYLRVSY